MEAIEKRDLDTAENTVADYPMIINLTSNYGLNKGAKPIHVATKYRNAVIISELMEKGSIDINEPASLNWKPADDLPNDNNWTPLRIACYYCDEMLVSTLLDRYKATVSSELYEEIREKGDTLNKNNFSFTTILTQLRYKYKRGGYRKNKTSRKNKKSRRRRSRSSTKRSSTKRSSTKRRR